MFHGLLIQKKSLPMKKIFIGQGLVDTGLFILLMIVIG